MLRKTTAAVVLAGALALGTASATSLGTFNSPTFAASDTDLLACDVGDAIDLLSLLPDIPQDNDPLAAAGATLDLGLLDLSPLTTALSDLETATGVDCLTGTVLDLVFVDTDGNVLGALQNLDVDTDLSAVDVTGENIDIGSIVDIRAVLREA